MPRGYDPRLTLRTAQQGRTAWDPKGYVHPGVAPPEERPVFTPPEFEMPEGPAYVAPKRDVGRVEELRTKAAAPGVRSATQAMQRALMQEYRNPNLARLAMRDILAGHGEALSSIYGGAAQTAEAQYAPEFTGQQAAGRMEYEAGWVAKREKAMADWQAKVEVEKRAYEWELMQGDYM